MGHPLEQVIRNAENFVLIGDSSQGRFPAQSFHSYTSVGKRFYCLDVGGLKESRGASPGHKVYNAVEELPEDRGDLAIIWVKPSTAKGAVELAHAAGCRRVWFSFGSGHREAVERARALEMEVVEIGRCPVYYMDRMTPACKAHTLMVKATRAYQKPPQTDAEAKHRELV